MDNNFKRLFSVGRYKDLGYLCDAQLLTEDGWSFDVHRIILAARNMYFRAFFNKAHKTQNIFHIRGIKGSILEQILYYIYSTSLPDKTEINLDLLVASDFFLVDSLMHCINKYLMNSISAENALRMYMVSFNINDTELLKFSYRYIQTHFQALIANNLMNFQEISFECLKNILNDNNLYVTGERTVWKCIEKWVKIDPSCRLSSLPELLKCLKSADMDNSLAHDILRSDIMSKNPLYKDSIGTEYLSQSNCSLCVLKNIIRSSAGDSDPPIDYFQSHRHPKCLNVIAKHENPEILLYVSYDENVDLWRRMGEIDDCHGIKFLIVVGFKIYILKDLCNINMVFDLCTKQSSRMLQPRFPRSNYKAVKLGSKIFIIGGKSNPYVEFYDTEQGKWFDAMPMMPPAPELEDDLSDLVSGFGAASYQNQIFVIGWRRTSQVYDAALNRWLLFTPPNLFTAPSIFIECRGKLYIIGGCRRFEYISKKVEVFDIAAGSWEFIPDLPGDFEPYTALVLHDQLIVFDRLSDMSEKVARSPVTWNEEERLWKPLDKSFLWYSNCSFDSVHSDVEIGAIVKELRDPTATFEKSPFK